MMTEYKNGQNCSLGHESYDGKVHYCAILYSGSNGEQGELQMPGKLCIFVEKRRHDIRTGR